MEIQTEAQAAKVRAVMGAMIGKLREAKAAGDTDRVAELKAQYTTLQLALQEYKAALPEPDPTATTKQTAPTEKLSDLRTELRQVKAEAKEAKTQLAEAEKTIKIQRATISKLKYDLELITDEVRTLRAPAPTQEYQRVQYIKPTSAPPVDVKALWAEIDSLGVDK